MAEIKLKGNSIHTTGNLPKVGESAPTFTLTKTDLSDVTNKDFVGKRVVLNIFPTIRLTNKRCTKKETTKRIISNHSGKGKGKGISFGTGVTLWRAITKL